MDTLKIRIAQGLEEAIRKQETGELFELGEGWDELQMECIQLDSKDETETIRVAMHFWESWDDSAQHGWLHYDPMTEKLWPKYANEIALSLREGKRIENEQILQQFTPRESGGLFSWLGRVLGGGT